MPCIDTDQRAGAAARRRLAAAAACAVAAALTGCSLPTGMGSGSGSGSRPSPDAGVTAPTGPAARGEPPVALAPITSRARNWEDYRLQAARRLVAANPQRSHLGEVQEPLLAIPVLEVELNGDGSVRRVIVSRYPGQARDTVQLAIDAVQRAAPFGPVSHLPRPWKFTEVFLFNDDRRFKPRMLDE